MVRYSLAQYRFEDAIFLAERLHAEGNPLSQSSGLVSSPLCSATTDESTHLLAICYYQSGRVQQARHLLTNHSSPHNAVCDLLYARCCLELGE